VDVPNPMFEENFAFKISINTMLRLFANLPPHRTLDQILQLPARFVDLAEHETFEEVVDAINFDGPCHP
jgi:hypothetical protein